MSTPSTTTPPNVLRSLYRQFLRELPSRPPSHRSPLQDSIRSRFSAPPPPPSPVPSTSATFHTSSKSPNAQTPSTSPPPGSSASSDSAPPSPAAAHQFLAYLRAQRIYTALLERYNPGMNMNEEEKVRLTARRVGMDLPEELGGGGAAGGGGGGGGGE